MMALPRFGSSKSFALYYKRVLMSVTNPRIAPEIIQIIVNLVKPPSNQLIVYKGSYNQSFRNPAFSDILTNFDLDVVILNNEISPFIEDCPIKQLLSANNDTSNMDIIISINSISPLYKFVNYLIESFLSSPLFVDNNQIEIESNCSSCSHPLYWIGSNAGKCTMNTAYSNYCQSLKYFAEFSVTAFYKSCDEMKNMLLDIYNLRIPYQSISISHISNNDISNNLLNRQFHECVFHKLSQQIIIFGGYGTSISMLNNRKKSKSSKLPRSRLNDIICLKYDDDNNQLIYNNNNMLSLSHSIPKARQHHSMVIVKNNRNHSFIFMFGGRSNPYKPFNDYWLYDITNYQWIQLKIDNDVTDLNDIPCSRYRHSMCTISDDKVLIFGGISVENKSQKLLNDMFIIKINFDSLSIKTNCIRYRNNKNSPQNIPIPRCSMTVQCINDGLLFSDEINTKILIFGGLINLNCYSNEMINDSNVYIFDLIQQRWDILETFNNGPLGLYGHSWCLTENKDSIIMAGGVMMTYDPLLNSNELKYNENVWRLQINTRLWHCYKIHDKLKEKQINIAQKVLYLRSTDKHDIVWLIGGGINVFSFGSVYGSVVQLKLPINRI